MVSQNGYIDLPYENTTIFVSERNNVIACYDGNDYVLATYSNKEKVAKAMEMLRKAHMGISSELYTKDLEINLDKLIEKIKKSEIVFDYNRSKYAVTYYFQFPKDEEIEVVE